MGVLDDIDVMIDVDCPRCERAVQQQFYGPCERCLAELRMAYQAESSAAEVVEYEPKMNVTPNAVALKDD
ncbi:hypothetical protein [Actinospongicola halichondriae]|uniref:hypothetical protein n=1 Tax=Actinospongicola halichondriae TaxID=3236844 RepID=UPI003D44B9A9